VGVKNIRQISSIAHLERGDFILLTFAVPVDDPFECKWMYATEELELRVGSTRAILRMGEGVDVQADPGKTLVGPWVLQARIRLIHQPAGRRHGNSSNGFVIEPAEHAASLVREALSILDGGQTDQVHGAPNGTRGGGVGGARSESSGHGDKRKG